MAGTYGSVSIDGNFSDWTQPDLITSVTGNLGNFDIYGKYAGGAYLFAVKSSSSASIGTNTTFFLNTDQNTATGGGTGGAEYYVNVFSDSIPYLYTGNGEYIKPLDYAYDASKQFLEFAVLSSDIPTSGISPTAINFIGDVNDNAFFPADYASGFQFTLSSVAAPPPQTIFGSITLDGNLSDWTLSDRLDYLPGTSVSGYKTYGKFTGDAYTFAIEAPTGTIIGTNTTFWLDTDRNAKTGYQIFGTLGSSGAEFQINIDPDGKAYLYKATGTNSLSRVSNTPLSFAFNSSRNILELAAPISSLGSNPEALNIYADVNNSIYLPGDYNANYYSVFANRVLPSRTDTSKKIAIVYSETTAKQYFGLDETTNKTAYSQLFMSVQNQAMQAGVPFDLLTESDLKNLSKLVNYDAIVFPSFRFVNQGDVQAIEDNLQALVYQYGIGLITSGDFMTNDENNGTLAGDPYRRMKTLLNVNPTTFGSSPTSVTVNAGDTTHPIMQGYAANEVIRSYANLSSASYDTTYQLPTAKVVLETQTINGTKYNAALATQTGLSQTLGGTTTARNVHFAIASYMADDNLLWRALDWSIFNGQPSVSLHLSRSNNLFLTRVDMDEAMAAAEIKPTTGTGIYDKLMPILNQWKSQYNYVGSYYIDIGNQNPTQSGSEYYTNWAVSSAYYRQLLAAGNEIGSHSYTHLLEYAGYGTPYEDTNAVLGKTALINGQTWDILQYEFQESKRVIEQNLGITVTGAAIPGAPEKLPTSLEISQYYSYISGGYTGVGAGYPSAFGFLLPGQEQVYFAPNLSFDFTLLEFGIPVWNGTTYVPQKLTAAQAAQEWVKEYSTLINKADNAIVLMPWHDYGPTNFFNKGYTIDMFSTLIAKAFADGAEFTTLDDANNRIRAFEQSKLYINSTGNTITATVAPDGTAFNTGKMGLEVDGNRTIKSVNNWYAYNDKTIFLPTNGGTFTINLNQLGQSGADDVTRITNLPMRAELLSVSGDGTNLNFSFKGSGKVVIDLKNPTGQVLRVTGADASQLTGEILELTFNQLGTYNVSIQLTSNPIAPITVSQGTTAGTVIDLGQLFTGITTPIKTSVLSVSNPNLVTASTLDNKLFLSYEPSRAGTSIVTIQGVANGTLVQSSITVTVNPFTGRVVTGTSSANLLLSNATSTIPSLVLGLGGNDTLQGASTGTSYLYGGSGTDTLTASIGASYLNGGAGNDTLNGGSGPTTLVGGSGNDTLRAGLGNTTLIGVDPFSAFAGRGEIDRMQGSFGSDTFVLGDQHQVYYTSGSSTTGGTTDYALISNFQADRDRIQLKGASTDYVVKRVLSGLLLSTAIYLKGVNGAADELIAIVEGNWFLDLRSSAFIYV